MIWYDMIWYINSALPSPRYAIWYFLITIEGDNEKKYQKNTLVWAELSLHFCQTSGTECATTPSSARELRLDDLTLSKWRYDSMGTLFPGVQKATLYICTYLRADHLDTLPLPALGELCLKRDPDPRFECEFTEWASLCERLSSSFSRLQKVAFIDLPIGGDNARMILSSLGELHPKLAEIR